MRGSVSASALPLLLALRRLSRRALCAAKAITDGGAHCCGWRSMARREVVGGGKFSHQWSAPNSAQWNPHQGPTCQSSQVKCTTRGAGACVGACACGRPPALWGIPSPPSPSTPPFTVGFRSTMEHIRSRPLTCLGCLLSLYMLYLFDLTSLAERTSGGRWIDRHLSTQRTRTSAAAIAMVGPPHGTYLHITDSGYNQQTGPGQCSDHPMPSASTRSDSIRSGTVTAFERF